MAEMNAHPETGRQRGGRRSKKLSTRVDMTPMVDLGFLLITFFMLTTTMAHKRAMNLIMPADGPSMPIGESKSLSILIGKNNKVAWYDTQYPDSVHISNFSQQKGIGDVIRAKQQRVAQVFGDASQLVICVKATTGARYQNVVDVMDEMDINRVKKYALVDITPEETRQLGE